MGAAEDFDRGMELASAGDYRGAIAAFKAAVSQTTEPKAQQITWRNIALCHLWLDEKEEADAAAALAGESINDYDSLRSIWEDLHEGGAAEQYREAMRLRDKGDHAGAVAAFDQALHAEELDDDLRPIIFGELAFAHLLADWPGRGVLPAA